MKKCNISKAFHQIFLLLPLCLSLHLFPLVHFSISVFSFIDKNKANGMEHISLAAGNKEKCKINYDQTRMINRHAVNQFKIYFINMNYINSFLN